MAVDHRLSGLAEGGVGPRERARGKDAGKSSGYARALLRSLLR